MGLDIATGIGRFMLQIPLSAGPGLGAQHHCKAPGDPWVKILMIKH